jgi:hypothetical protein
VRGAQHASDCDAVSEEAGVRTPRSCDGFASGATHTGAQSMPAPFQGHPLSHFQGKRRKCMVFRDRTKWFRGCGRAICGTPGDKVCYPWQVRAVVAGNLEGGAVQWPRGKQARV